jgi:membrane protein required for colicin V production
MTGFDYIVIAIFLLSALLGWWRGFVYEVLSLAGWVAAWLVARFFADSVAPYMPAVLGAGSMRTVAAFITLFFMTLLVGSLVSWLLSKLIRWVGLGWLDSLLGMSFGVLRGAIVVLVMVMLAGMTRIPQEPFWRNAWSSKHFESMAMAIHAWLPEGVAQRVRY